MSFQDKFAFLSSQFTSIPIDHLRYRHRHKSLLPLHTSTFFSSFVLRSHSRSMHHTFSHSLPTSNSSPSTIQSNLTTPSSFDNQNNKLPDQSTPENPFNNPYVDMQDQIFEESTKESKDDRDERKEGKKPSPPKKGLLKSISIPNWRQSYQSHFSDIPAASSNAPTNAKPTNDVVSSIDVDAVNELDRIALAAESAGVDPPYHLAALFLDKQTSEVAILCHGFRGSKNSSLVTSIAYALPISSIRFDFLGNNESPGEFKYANYWGEVEQLHAVVQYVRSTLNLHVKAIIGHSKSGSEVLMYAARYGDVDNVVNISGRFDMTRGITERFGTHNMALLDAQGYFIVQPENYTVTKDCLMQRLSLNMESVAQAVTKGQVLTVHGSQDATIPVDDAYQYDIHVATEHVLKIIDGADHNYTQPQHRRDVVQEVVQFVIWPGWISAEVLEQVEKSQQESLDQKQQDNNKV